MANKLKCDHSVIASIQNNGIYDIGSYDEELLKQWEKALSLSEKDLSEKYIPHNLRKLTREQVFEFCSVIFWERGYGKMLAEEFGVGSTVAHRL